MPLCRPNSLSLSKRTVRRHKPGGPILHIAKVTRVTKTSFGDFIERLMGVIQTPRTNSAAQSGFDIRSKSRELVHVIHHAQIVRLAVRLERGGESGACRGVFRRCASGAR